MRALLSRIRRWSAGASQQRTPWPLPLVLALTLVACTPALNWREVTVGRLHAVLPCKPDKASRPVTLAGATMTLGMQGCQADGALFAISHLQVADGAQAADVLQAWQAETLRNMQTPQVEQTLAAWQATPPNQPSTTPSQSPPILSAGGTGADGKMLQARLAWWLDGQNIYHLAAYGDTLPAQTIEPLFVQARLRD